MRIEDAAPNTSANLGQRLRTARLAHRMTQSDVANGQFSASYVSAVERGQLRPSLRALEMLAQRLHAPMADLLSGGGNTGEVPSTATHERVETPDLRDAVEQHLWQAQMFAQQGNTDEALSMLSRLRAQESAFAPHERGLWHWYRACVYLTLGLEEEARTEIQEAVPLAERDGDVELREWLRYGLGRVHQLGRQWPLALELYQACLAAIAQQTLVAPTLRLKVLSGLSDACWQLGEYDIALDYLAQASQSAQEFLDVERLATVYSNTSSTYSGRGDARRAREYAIRSVAASDQADAQRLAMQTYSRQGQIDLRSNRLDEACAALGTAREMAERWYDDTARVEALCGLAAVYLGQGHLGEAATTVELARDAANTLNDPAQQAEVLLVEARLLEAQGEVATACHGFERAVAILEESPTATQRLTQAYKDYSDFVERQGDSTRAYELLKKAWQLRDHALAGA